MKNPPSHYEGAFNVVSFIRLYDNPEPRCQNQMPELPELDAYCRPVHRKPSPRTRCAPTGNPATVQANPNIENLGQAIHSELSQLVNQHGDYIHLS